MTREYDGIPYHGSSVSFAFEGRTGVIVDHEYLLGPRAIALLDPGHHGERHVVYSLGQRIPVGTRIRVVNERFVPLTTVASRP